MTLFFMVHRRSPVIDANEQQEILEMSEEATLQIYDYFPRVSEESRVDIEVETTTQFENAQIDGFVIENPGVSYQVNDTVFFDNEGTGGFGASALIEKRMAMLDPQPKRKIPILIGGGGEKVTLRITAQYADVWHGFATKTEDRSGIETVAHKNSVLDNWCKEIGRDPSEIGRSIGIDLKRIDKADELVEAGATEITLPLNGPDYDMSIVKEWIAWRDSKD